MLSPRKELCTLGEQTQELILKQLKPTLAKSAFQMKEKRNFKRKLTKFKKFERSLETFKMQNRLLD